MTTISTAKTTHHTPPSAVRIGLALSALVGASNLIFLLPDIDWGNADPGLPLILLGAALGMVSAVCAALAWNSASRRLIRLDAAALIVNGLMIVPGLFVDTTTAIRLATAVMLIGTVAAVVLMMRRADRPATIVD